MRKISLIFVFVSSLLQAQFKQDSTKNVNYLFLPALFRTPETGWGYGASGSATFKTTTRKDTLTRTSSVNAAVIFTERGQNFQFIDATIYFPKEKYILYADIGHSYFPEFFWGLGPKTKDEWQERYKYEQYGCYMHIKKQLFDHFFTGLIYEFQNVFKIEYLDGGIFDTLNFTGKKPYANSGLGLSVSYDTRNKAFWPTKGFFFNSHVTRYNEGLGSHYDFTKMVIDVRLFQKIILNHVLAFQLYNYSTYGEPPMRNYARFGGQDNMRGFYQGRLRDRNMTTFIAEYRAPIIWRLSLVAFGGVGNVYSPQNPLSKNELRYSFGGGIRLSMLKKDNLNVRIDYGYYSKYNSGLYFTLGECF